MADAATRTAERAGELPERVRALLRAGDLETICADLALFWECLRGFGWGWIGDTSIERILAGTAAPARVRVRHPRCKYDSLRAGPVDPRCRLISWGYYKGRTVSLEGSWEFLPSRDVYSSSQLPVVLAEAIRWGEGKCGCGEIQEEHAQ